MRFTIVSAIIIALSVGATAALAVTGDAIEMGVPLTCPGAWSTSKKKPKDGYDCNNLSASDFDDMCKKCVKKLKTHSTVYYKPSMIGAAREFGYHYRTR